MAACRIVRRSRSRSPDYGGLGCPYTKCRSLRCRRLCVPGAGVGVCGRMAPHGLLGKTQEAILRRGGR